MNRSSSAPSSSIKTWVSRLALAGTVATGTTVGTSSKADAAPGDQVVKVINPDVFLCTDKPYAGMFRTRILGVIRDLTKPVGQDVTMSNTVELKQPTSKESQYQDTYGEPLTTYRQKYHVYYWPGDNKFEAGIYFIDKDSKTIALAIKSVDLPENAAFADLHIIEGVTPADDLITFGAAVIMGSPMGPNGTLQILNSKKYPKVNVDFTAAYKSTLIATKSDPKTGKTFLKRYQITKDDIVEMESVEFLSVSLEGFITYKDTQGKETTYIGVFSKANDFPTGSRRFDITDFKKFQDMDPDVSIACPDGRFEFKDDPTNPKKSIVTDTWNGDPNTNHTTVNGGAGTPIQGADVPTFVVSDDKGSFGIMRIVSTNPLKIEQAEYTTTATKDGLITNLVCIENHQSPPPLIETKPTVVEGAETSGAETATAEGGNDAAEGTVVEKEQPDAGGETIGGEEVMGGDGDAAGQNDSQGSDLDAEATGDGMSTDINPALDGNGTDVSKQDASTGSEDGSVQSDAGPSQQGDAIASTDATSKPDTIASAPPSHDSGCSASPLTTRASTRAALEQLGLFGMTLAGAYAMRRRKNEQRERV